MYFKNMEKEFFDHYPRYSYLKQELRSFDREDCVQPVVFLSGSTCESQADKPQTPSFLLSKGSTHTALLDFSFFDQLAGEERSAEGPKASRLLKKLFPVSIQFFPPKMGPEVAPSPNPKLTVWNAKMKADLQDLKLAANVVEIEKMLKANDLGIEGSIKDIRGLQSQTLDKDDVDRFVSLALGHSLEKGETKIEGRRPD